MSPPSSSLSQQYHSYLYQMARLSMKQTCVSLINHSPIIYFIFLFNLFNDQLHIFLLFMLKVGSCWVYISGYITEVGTKSKKQNTRVSNMETPNFVFFSLLLLLTSTTLSSAQLTRSFYKNVCPNVEQLVRSAVAQKFQQTFVTAPATLRLFFHDCFVRVCTPSSSLSSFS